MGWGWIDCVDINKYRLKPQPNYNKEIEALQIKAKENGMKELKHLAGYLPYGLKTLTGWNNIEEIIGFKDETYFIKGGNVYAYGDIQDCKPILRPLSDLTKDIEVDGDKFEPIVELKSQCGIIIARELDNLVKYKNYGDMPFWVIQKLYEWHFDIHNLIENGLAIDINTLNK